MGLEFPPPPHAARPSRERQARSEATVRMRQPLYRPIGETAEGTEGIRLRERTTASSSEESYWSSAAIRGYEREFSCRLLNFQVSNRRETDLMEITVYSTLWCPDCREAKRFLDRHQLPYTDINIETTPGAADEVVKRTGKRAIPQFVIDGEWVQPYRPGEGFLHEEMAKRLGIE